MRVKPVEGVAVKEAVEVALPKVVATVMGPVAAPAGTTKTTAVAETLVGGGFSVPPPSCGTETCVAAPRLVPTTVTNVPRGPVFGLKSVIVGPAAQPKPRAALITIWTSTTLTAPSLSNRCRLPPHPALG